MKEENGINEWGMGCPVGPGMTMGHDPPDRHRRRATTGRGGYDRAGSGGSGPAALLPGTVVANVGAGMGESVGSGVRA